jgi:hypothetical protein
MRLLMMAMAVGSAMAPRVAFCAETGERILQLRPKAAMMSAVTPVTPAQPGNAPFMSSPSAEPDLMLIAPPQNAQEATRSSCNGERSLCYDSVSGRVVYKPARAFMPAFPGLRPENISLKRNQLVLRYSF